jgi:hypothetical protein
MKLKVSFGAKPKKEVTQQLFLRCRGASAKETITKKH